MKSAKLYSNHENTEKSQIKMTEAEEKTFAALEQLTDFFNQLRQTR